MYNCDNHSTQQNIIGKDIKIASLSKVSIALDFDTE